jgi:hypothetical protein
MKWIALVSCFGFLTFSGLSQQVGVFFPGNAASTEGDGTSFDPCCIEYEGFPSERFQQVYDSSEFSTDVPNGGLINKIVFRVDGNARGLAEDIRSIQFRLSTSSRSSSSLSPVFTDNVGADDTIIFPAGRLIWGGSSPIEVPLSRPFFYNPKLGNLLLDVRVISPSMIIGQINTGLDAAHNRSMSVVFAPSVDATSGQVFNFGLVTFFIMTPIPEPATWALGILGGLTFVAFSCGFPSRWRGSPGKRL